MSVPAGRVSVMSDPKADLQRYLQRGREDLLWKLDGLSEYDVRRPMTSTGTNLLGLVKHVSYMELEYLGGVFGRPSPEAMSWDDETEPNVDMWARADESREDVIARYHRAWALADATVEALPLDAVGSVPWWPEERRSVTRSWCTWSWRPTGTRARPTSCAS